MRRHTLGAPAITWLLLIAGAALGLGLDGSAQARYPKQILRVATHSSPGGGSDVFLREMAPHLSRIMGVDGCRGQPAGRQRRSRNGNPRSLEARRRVALRDDAHVHLHVVAQHARPRRTGTSSRWSNVFFDPEVIYTAADSKFKTLGDIIAAARKRSAHDGGPPTRHRSNARRWSS